jgi:hypothetical protein
MRMSCDPEARSASLAIMGRRTPAPDSAQNTTHQCWR